MVKVMGLGGGWDAQSFQSLMLILGIWPKSRLLFMSFCLICRGEFPVIFFGGRGSFV